MSLESPTTLRQNLLGVIQDAPEEDLQELLQTVRVFRQRTLVDSIAQNENPQWQQAIDAISTQNETIIEQRKTNISKLIADLNKDEDLEEQQQALDNIRSIESVSI